MSDLAHYVYRALVEESGFLESEEFCEAVENTVNQKITDEVEKNVNEIDIPSLIKNEMPDYSEVEKKVEDLEISVRDWMNEDIVAEHSVLIKGLQEQNTLLFAAIGELERKVDVLRAEQDVTVNVFEEIWSRIRKSRCLNWLFSS
jgi:hypothetical protein